jgi:hypothetical protein
MGHKHLGFSKAGMTQLLKASGFADVHYRELPTEPEARGPGLFVATARVS